MPWSNRYLSSTQCLTNCVSRGSNYSSLTNHGGGSSTVPNSPNSYLRIAQPLSRYHNLNRKLGSCLEHTRRFYCCSSHQLTIKKTVVLYFKYSCLTRVYKFDLSEILPFKYLHHYVNQSKAFDDNPLYPFEKSLT